VNPWRVILATLVIFVAGVVTGGLLVSYADRAQQKNRRFQPRENVRLPANANPSPFGGPRDARESQSRLPNPLQNRMPRGVSMEFLQKLDSEVRLTSEQRERIEKIIADGQLRNKELWERVAPEMRREMAETQKRIREELTPEQRARFEELMKQSRPTGQRKADETKQPERRPRDQRDVRRPIPPRDAPAGSPEKP
jgi:Spy/CpxP family protein refolding chaperone